MSDGTTHGLNPTPSTIKEAPDPVELDIPTLAALYALGATPSRASENFEALLIAGDIEARDEWSRVRGAADVIARMGPEVEPSAGVRKRLEEFARGVHRD